MGETEKESGHDVALVSLSDQQSADGTVPLSARRRWESVGERPLAQRGQGAVWRVDDREDPRGEHYALKEMRYRKGPSSLAHRRFVREINVMTALSGTHPGIVPVKAHGIPADGDEWEPFYVIPLAQSSLERARDLAGSLAPVLKIGIRIAGALEVAHDNGVIHRDVKPGNVLLFGDDRQPALADFGICHLEDDERLTGTDAQTVGSRDYVAPELLGGGLHDAVSPRVDIYSLGKTLYAVAAGRDPFPREAHREQEWDLATRFRDSRFEHLHGLLDRMVTLDPNSRFATMRECREAMERALQNVQNGRPYHAGMYGGDRVAIERYYAALNVLRRSSGRERGDAQVAAVDESERIVVDMIVRTTPEGTDVEYARGLQPGDSELALACANHLLVPPVLGTTLGLDELVEEWWGRLKHLALPENFRTRRDVLLAEAAAAAAYGAAAIAWRRRRWEILREIVSVIAHHKHPFIYMDVGEGHSRKSAAWVSTFIAQSELIRHVEPDVSTDPDGSLGIVSGLAVLVDLIETPDKVLRTLTDPNTRIDGADYAALYPDFREWVDALPQAALKSPPVGRGVAQALGISSTPELQIALQRVTPVLRRWMAQVASRLNRDSFWLGEFGKRGLWARWIGAETNAS